MPDYNSHYVQRPRNADGCATFIKKQKMEIIKVEKINLAKPNTFSNRENICMLILAKQDNKYLILANTHILYNPKRGLVKAAQIIYILEQIYKLMHEYKCYDSRIIMGGDFNLSPTGLLYHFITQGALQLSMVPEQLLSGQMAVNSPKSASAMDTTDLPSEIVHPFHFKSAYEAVQTKEGQPWKYTQDLKGRQQFNGLFVDYLFYGHLKTDAKLYLKNEDGVAAKFSPLQFQGQEPTDTQFTPNLMELVKTGVLPDPFIDDMLPMPNESDPSDHYSVYAEFQ